MAELNVAYETYGKITNVFKEGTKGDCSNNFGNYFTKCNKPTAEWGYIKPLPLNQGSGNRPCHAIWNNATRKIVDN